MLQNLSLQELEELQATLKKAEELFNPKHLEFKELFKTSNRPALIAQQLHLEVTSNIYKISTERDNK